MKKLIAFTLSGMLAFGAYAQQPAATKLAIGSALPETGYQTTDVLSGKTYTLQELKTKNGLLVIFTCNTCPFVLKNSNRTREILDVAQDEGIGVMMVNANEAQRDGADSKAQMKAFAEEHDYPNYVIDAGSALADAFHAQHTPQVFLFDSQGLLVYEGAMDDSPANPEAAKKIYLKDAMEHMVAGEAINPNQTKSLGCSIKRVKK
jgi:hypothetical protein